MPHPPTRLEPGAVLSGRYRLDAPVGRGATSTVWRARDLDLGRVVAVKVLEGADGEERFEREGRLLGRLAHPNLVAVHGAGRDGPRRYLVTDLVDGVPLDQVLREGPLPVDDALRLVAWVAAGLATAHAAGIVHRDVKPANIVCERDGTPRLVDFGIARASDVTALTTSHTLLGTAAYLAPEQARGLTPGPAGDVYSLGCVLHELLTGAPPFDGDSAVAVAYRHVHEEPRAPSERAPEVPVPVDALVLRCLAKDPMERYPDAAALVADLDRVLAGGQPAPTPWFPVASVPAGDPDATVAVPASGSTAGAPADGTLVLPAVAEHGERIDPSPLAPVDRASPRWAWFAAAGAAVLLVALLLGALSGGGSGPAPVEAGEDPAPTTTVVTAASVEDPHPEPGPPPDAGRSRGGGPPPGRGRGR